MRGTILIFRPGERRPEVREIDGEPTLALLKDAIGGGYLELVPRWNMILHDHTMHQCVAFCDEDGKLKGLFPNMTATMLWDGAMRRAYGVGCAPDYLAGDIAVVFGDEEFMEAL